MITNNVSLQASQTVELGLDHSRPGTFTCRNIGKALNGLPVISTQSVKYKQWLDHNWYFKCKGQNEDYWDDPEKYTGRGIATGIGLLASQEWKDVRDGGYNIFAVVALQTCKIKRRSSDRLQPGVLQFKGMAYAIIRSSREFLDLYRQMPPGDRFLQEVILPSTPHKCVMDIEKDFDSSIMSQSELHQEMTFMKKGLHEMFVPLICQVFTDKLGIPVRREDCYITDSSKHGIKFSTHLVITTPGKHYFKNRMESWVAMALIAKYVRLKADHDARFRKWFFFRDTKEEVKSTWDFGVYGKGARNMRLIGACKGDKRVLSSHWNDCRVFLPINEYGIDQRRAPFQAFVSSLYDTSRATLIKYEQSTLDEVRDFMMEIARSKHMAENFWMRNSFRLANYMVMENMVDRVDRNGRVVLQRQNSSMTSRTGSSSTGRHFDNPEHERLFDEIQRMGTRGMSGEAGDAFFDDMLEYDKLTRRKFNEKAMWFLKSVAEAVHPCSRPVTVSPGGLGRRTGIYYMQFRPTVFERPDLKRLCHYGCTQGRHSVNIYINIDFSVGYYCFSCHQGGIIVDSPVRPGVVPFRLETVTPCPSDFADGFIDYAVVPHNPDDGEDDHHMRKVRRVDNTYIPIGVVGGNVEQRTIVAQGPMGSGKTVMTRGFLEHVRTQKPDAKIIAFSFRRMLATMFANAFGLLDYSKHSDLYEANGVAIQLESIARLGRQAHGQENDGDLSREFRRVYDVVIIDEIESVLAHFDSETLKDRLYMVWRIFFEFVRCCRCLIVCDADVGPRTFQFIRMTRLRGDRIPRLEFHYNTYVAIKTKYYDYMGEAEWYNTMLSFLLAEKNVFFFSNNKTRMRAVKRMIVADLSEMKQKRINMLLNANPDADVVSDPRVAFLDGIMGAIMIVDADITEKEKQALTKCNDEWVKYKLVMISPAVGAGIDFTKKHFHVAFGYATAHSCSARALNQMRGRVRDVLLGQCHLFIKEDTDLDLQQAVLDQIKAEGSHGPGFNPDDLLVAAEQEDESDEIMRRERPLTLASAREQLRQDRICYMSDMVAITESSTNPSNYVARMVSIPEQLQVVLALNMVERNRSKTCFRGEFIKVLQMGDPDVEYMFNAAYDHDANHGYYSRLVKLEREDAKAKTATIAAQKEVGLDEYLKYQRSDRGKRRPPDSENLPDPELSEEQVEEVAKLAMEVGPDAADAKHEEFMKEARKQQKEALKKKAEEQEKQERSLELPDGVVNERAMQAFLQKNKIKHFYGIRDDVTTDLWNEFIRCAGNLEVQDCVIRIVEVLGTSIQDLRTDAEDRGTLRQLDIHMESQEIPDRYITLNQRTVDEIWPSNMMLRWWTSVLLYAAGFDVTHPADIFENDNPMEILPGVGCGQGHRHTSAERLKDTEMQMWLNERAAYMMSKCNIRKREKQNHPLPDEEWNYKYVFSLTKQFFWNCYNIELRSSRARVRKKKNADDDGMSVSSSISSSSSRKRKRGEDETASVISNGLTERSMVSIVDLCAQNDMERPAFRNQTRCPRGFHGDKSIKCNDLFHAEDNSLALMISLASMYIFNPWSGKKDEPTIRVVARENFQKILHAWNRKPFLMDYHVSRTIDQLEATARDRKAAEALEMQREDGLENIYEEEEARMKEEEEAEGLQGLERVKTISDKMWAMRMNILKKKHREDKELETRYRKQLVQRYLGTDVIKQPGHIFASIMTSSTFEAKYVRFLSTFKRKMESHRQNLLSKV
jgi:hypothetical protein